jgi:hypothetical protein
MPKLVLLALLVAAASGCSTVHPWQRGRLAGPTMQFAVDAYAGEQVSTITEITEGATYAGQPGNAGAGCGCH